MIIHSPEPSMAEPYDSYVTQRAAMIGDRLKAIVGATNVQLCSRPILPHEVQFGDQPESLLFGAVVRKLSDADKSFFYRAGTQSGIVAYNAETAIEFARTLLAQDDRVRLKDPCKSNGRGQTTVETIVEAASFLSGLTCLQTCGVIVMPHLCVRERLAIARLALGELGTFTRYGREYSLTAEDGSDMYGGTDIALARSDNAWALKKAAEDLQIAPNVLDLAQRGLNTFTKTAVRVGYTSVDILVGKSDSGKHITEVVDLTARIGGATPAEVEALEPLTNGCTLAYGSSRLHYGNAPRTTSGIRYVDTPSLTITADVTKLIS